ncbi:hypothetical protein A1OE_546 [Candidatus Endolissoclinum faulkneri L2]|uniref:DUF2333 family protein n=1 Tax=Candidatus Endolissoclinum faulkneri L2 TaxID=1193729 RepID=K7YQ92_9PROT|nr:DUF2333 family protein [Candidatus Endolissoclinum faulkneri]AFX98739.1 hypothetical protein A1OE_546 [Candidatus Endolissoclinum faulkneri L2]
MIINGEYFTQKCRTAAVTSLIKLSSNYIISIFILILLYYLLGAYIINNIEDDLKFRAIKPPEGGSYAVSATAALIDREVDTHFWTPNDPFFYPSALLDNMLNYQQGILYALSRFTIEMADQIGRTRGSSEVDSDLDKAAGLLKYPGNVWIFDLSTSFLPTPSSETQYRAASKALKSYNSRLANSKAIFEERSDNLISTLDRIAADLGSASATTDKYLTNSHPLLIDTKVDDIFYGIKGKLYGYYILLHELEKDFNKVIHDKQLLPAWEQMMKSFNQAALLQPLVVMNNRPNGIYLPNHLAVQGFYLLRARTQLREITNILMK